MSQHLQKLLEGTVLNEETKTALQEAWNQKLDEARDEISQELREEFANRYEHDKNIVIEATEKMVKEAIKEEFDELAKDKKAIKETKLKLKEQLELLSEKSFNFMKAQLSEEMKEFRSERHQVNEGLMKLQGFVKTQLSEELSEFSHDRNALIKERVNFEKTKDKELKEAKRQFVETASKLSEKVIRESLQSEMKQLRHDLKESKKNMFGKKLFEAFASEFMNSHYNEKSHVNKLNLVLENTNKELKQLKEALNQKDQAINEAKKEAKKHKLLKERADLMNTLLSPLNKEQQKVMKNLLESSSNDKLQDNFNKYISMVLNEDVKTSKNNVLVESKNNIRTTEYDGNRNKLNESVDENNDDSIIRLKALSGIKA